MVTGGGNAGDLGDKSVIYVILVNSSTQAMFIMVYQITRRLKTLYRQIYSEFARWLSLPISARILLKTTVSFRLLR
ncbi:hypothetical protein BHU62_04610 [Serratia marcescens]|uniref:Uncharacterized protein n=1 Tax=Serratia marcescens TaxID=615 RepID=A0A1Q4P3R3_SERMA|nr:hypothetical protein BHU62_04610 [Serratia marcescens]